MHMSIPRIRRETSDRGERERERGGERRGEERRGEEKGVQGFVPERSKWRIF